MKIAFTADLHLTTQEKNPERFQTFNNILSSLPGLGIEHLVIAGDLFDRYQDNYTDFEIICKKHTHTNLHVIPGNHDPGISSKAISAENVQIYTQPELVQMDESGLLFLFLPYQENKSMGEIIASYYQDFEEQAWILVGHGDYFGNLRYLNAYEEGIYMPLSRKDVQRFTPRRVILGHIHHPHEKEGVYYCGSPCGMDITEVGRRRFLILDTVSLEVVPYTVDSPFIYFDEVLTVLPVEDERNYLVQKAKERFKAWNISKDEFPKVRLRVRVNGYSADKSRLTEMVKEIFKDFHQVADPDLQRVSVSNDMERTAIALNIVKRIARLNWINEANEPSSEKIFEHAMRIIYGA